MSWLEKLMPSQMRNDSAAKKSTVPEGLWTKCSNCGAVLYSAEMERSLEVCPKCNAHQRLRARKRLDLFLDADNREELALGIEPEAMRLNRHIVSTKKLLTEVAVSP